MAQDKGELTVLMVRRKQKGVTAMKRRRNPRGRFPRMSNLQRVGTLHGKPVYRSIHNMKLYTIEDVGWPHSRERYPFEVPFIDYGHVAYIKGMERNPRRYRRNRLGVRKTASRTSKFRAKLWKRGARRAQSRGDLRAAGRMRGYARDIGTRDYLPLGRNPDYLTARGVVYHSEPVSRATQRLLGWRRLTAQESRGYRLSQRRPRRR